MRLIDSGEETARPRWSGARATAALDGAGRRRADATGSSVSDDEARFRQVGARFIGERLGRAEVVPLG